MSRNQKRFPYSLDSGKIRKLSDEELRMILRAADEIIATGGRSMLTKILKGSKDKKILEYHLDKSPAYGAFSELSAEEVSNRVDWAIEHDYLAIEYSKKLPLIVFTPAGWEIEKETYTNELFENFREIMCEISDLERRKAFIEILKTRNRQVILLLLDKIAENGDESFIPLLEEWKTVEVKKVSGKIDGVINRIRGKNKQEQE